MGKNPAQKAKAAATKATDTKKEVKVEKKAKAKKVSAKAEANSAKACKISGCTREYRAKGYCQSHYKKWRNGAYGKVRYTSCSDHGCFKPMALNRHGYCEDHFQNYYVKGMAVAKAPAAAPAAPAKEEKKEAASA